MDSLEKEGLLGFNPSKGLEPSSPSQDTHISISRPTVAENQDPDAVGRTWVAIVYSISTHLIIMSEQRNQCNSLVQTFRGEDQDLYDI